MLPSLLNVFLQEIILQINIIYVGKFNNEKMLDGIGLANTLISCTSMSMTVGLSGVLETFVS
jgi:Na+-driven multidrug efflux pump